ncbi:GNAT family N-acetyltransferase [Streptomyces sp. NPDC058579]|uniref:GNAT family N-acetyltransferase n=1 Tax=Streptomyces sp. NPDC058579 TaxID=3346548 RepID=UPI00364DEBE9
MASMLSRLETYYDAVPRSAARAEEFGALTLFVREGRGWPYYARPALGHIGEVPLADVERVRARQRELGVPEAFEWVAETTPGLRAAVEQSGLVVHEHPLMILEGEGVAVSAPDGVTVRMVEAGDPALASAAAVPYAAFGVTPDASVAEQLAARIGAGLTRLAAAVDADGTALSAGQHQPVGTALGGVSGAVSGAASEVVPGAVSEVVGVGTLPAARRRGLGLAVTAALVADARARGVGTVFLSATDESVARLYGRLGFRTAGTALIAEPAS